MKKGIQLIVGFIIIIFAATMTGATGLYAVDGADGAGGGPSTLYELDPATGAIIQTIGPVGFDAVKGIAIHPTAGIICGVVSNGGTGQTALLTMNPETGAGALVGDTTKNISDITFSADGVLYGWSEDAGDDDLVTIDLSTGLATVVGDFGTGTGSTGLSFDGAGRLILKDHNPTLHLIDTSTGLPTYLAALEPPPSLNRYRNVLAFNPDNGLMYTAEKEVDPAPIYTFAIAVGVDPIPTTLIGTGPSGLTALAFGDPIPADESINGEEITAEWLYPTAGDVLESHVVFVGLPVELPADVIINDWKYSIDLGGRSIRFDFHAPSLWDGMVEFNGWRFTDTLDLMDDIKGFRIAGFSPGVTGLDHNNLGWDAESVWANFAGMQVAGDGDYIVLEFIDAYVFSDGFESGNTSAWSLAVP